MTLEHKYLCRPQKSSSFGIQGQVSPGFEAVLEVFVDNFVLRRELVGACCAFVCGEKVVDLWGGIRNRQSATSGANISRQPKLNRRTYLVSMVMMPARLMLKLPVAKMLEKLARNNGARAAATATKVREKGPSTTL